VELFAPFPWQITSLRSALTMPEQLLWWLLTPAWIRGIVHVLRARRIEATPLLAFAILLGDAYSTFHGNVGVIFRQRAQIVIILHIFAALGHYVKLCKKMGIDPKVLAPLPAPPVRA
jgi:hypothetical protein